MDGDKVSEAVSLSQLPQLEEVARHFLPFARLKKSHRHCR